jgi:transcription elongation factor Elf1
MSNAEQQASRKTAPTSYLCPKCEQEMRVTFVEPVDEEHEKRLFECSACKEFKTVVVSYR